MDAFIFLTGKLEITFKTIKGNVRYFLHRSQYFEHDTMLEFAFGEEVPSGIYEGFMIKAPKLP